MKNMVKENSRKSVKNILAERMAKITEYLNQVLPHPTDNRFAGSCYNAYFYNVAMR